MPSPAIVCDALTRDFGEIRALDGLTFSVPAGSVFAFLGPNGAGKTTTLHLLLGIIEPTSGAARVLGLDPVMAGSEIRRRSGALLEFSGLYERLTAVDNLRFYASIAHLERDRAERRIHELLTRFGLWERREDRVGTWSRGMKQKLAIARVLLHEPALIFLDEPTAGLDPEATVALRRDIVSLAGSEGATVFLTTHNLADVEKMATHVAVLRGGQLLDYGTPAELRARAIRSKVTIRMSDRDSLALELAPGESVAPVVTELVRDGAQIEEVRREEPSIEDVFLHLVQRALPATERDPSSALCAPSPLSRGEKDVRMLRDAGAVVRKEWSEVMSGSSKINTIAGCVFLAIIAAFAAVIGGKLIRSPATLSVLMIAFIVLLATIADSFAGERERHTLETLLASAIPDEALLLGKISASVVYGWGATLILLAVLLLGANITDFGVFYPPAVLLGALVLTPLMLFAFSTAGVLLSLRAPTVRDAQTRLSALLFGLMIPLVALRPFLPEAWKQQAVEMLRSGSGLLQAIVVQSVFFAALDVVLLAVAVAQFRRARLITR